MEGRLSMSYSFKRSAIGIGVAAAAVAAMSMLVPLTKGQVAGFRASRFVDGRPDLNGFWQAVGAAHWDIEAHHAQPGPPQFGALFSVPAGLGVGGGGSMPYHTLGRQQRGATSQIVG